MGRRLYDLVGQKFGRWTVVEYRGEKHWMCRCDCGTEGIKQGGALKLGKTQSCGCLQRELITQRNYRHGMVDHPAYWSWDSAKRRCRDLNRRHYGGKGIKMCPEWEASFETFWAYMGPSWQPGLSIDRIESDGDYEPGNCRWATPKEQSNNRLYCVQIETPEGRMNITQAAERFGINRWTLTRRLDAGWTAERLFSSPIVGRQRKKDRGN